MKLAGQGSGGPSSRGERGYAMAALLVGMSVMAILMSAALPSWTHMTQREKEEEYLFRAKQYARAIRAFQDKNGGGMVPAPSVDFLIEQRFLRKKYKDPLTNDDFVLLQTPPGVGSPGLPGAGGGGFGAPGQAGQTGQPGRPGQGGQQQGTQFGQFGQTPQGQGQQPGGIAAAGRGAFIGVTSKSKQKAIKLFKGQQTTYDQWAMTFMDVPSAVAQGRPGQAGTINPGGAGQSPFGPGGGGQSPFAPGGGQGGFGQPMAPGTSPFGQQPMGQQPFGQQPFGQQPFGQPSPTQGGPSPFQIQGGQQSVPKFPPLPGTTGGTNPFQGLKPPPK